MHPRTATLVAYSDAELDAGRSRRIAGHLQSCARCQNNLERLNEERRELSVLHPTVQTPPLASQGLTALLAAIARWREDPEPELRNRVRNEIEIYFGRAAALSMERPGIRADELLAKTLALSETFLGPEAAEAVLADILRGLNCAALTAEVSL